MARKRPASVSLDLDNKWSYIKTHGDPGWESFPSYLDIVVPRALEFLERHQLTITFFVVGQDAALEENAPALRLISGAGHEIGNHSFNHEPWLHLYSEQQIECELALTEEHLERVTGQRPIGFRGPGYSLSEAVLKVLQRRGYQYDCSTFPTFLGPLSRLYYFMTTRLNDEEKEQRKKLFGGLKEGLRSNRPYRWQLEGAQLLEIPVTTIPVFKLPMHASYVLFLAKFSRLLALTYFRFALGMCGLTGIGPSLLLHPLDFMTVEDAPELAFFPAMKIPLAQKLDVLNAIVRLLQKQFELMSMREHAEAIAHKNLSVSKPRFG